MNPAIWLVKSIEDKQSTPRFLSRMEFAMGNQVSQYFFFQTVLRKTKWKLLFKKNKIPYFGGTYDPKSSKSEISANIRRSFLRY